MHAPSEPAPRRSTLDRWSPPALAALVGAALLARLWLVFNRLFDPDELEHLHAGYCVWQGMVPYRDFFEQHGPVLWYVSLPFFYLRGASLNVLFAGRFVIWLLGAVSLALTWHVGTRLLGRWGGPVAAMLLVFAPSFQEKHVEWRPDNVAVPLILVSVIAADRALAARSICWSAAFGAALAGAFLCTQKIAYIGVGLGAGFTLALLTCRRRRAIARPADPVLDPARDRLTWGGVATLLLAVCAGGSAVIVLFLAVFARAGALRQLVEMTVLLPLRWQTRVPVAPYLWKIALETPIFCGALAAGLIGCIAEMRRGGERGALLQVLLAGIAAHIAGLMLVPAAYLQYYLPLWPLAALVAARALVGLTGDPKCPASEPASRSLHLFTAVVGIGIVVTLMVLRWTLSARFVRWDAAFLAACIVASLTALASRRAAVIATLIAGAIAGTPHLWIQFGPWTGIQRQQRREMERLLRATTPDDRFLDGFTGMGALRPHAFFHFWINHHSWPMIPNDAKSAGLMNALADERTRVVLLDADLRAVLPREARRLLESEYGVDVRYQSPNYAVLVRRGRELPPPYDASPEVEETF